jgi:hypothetical protein
MCRREQAGSRRRIGRRTFIAMVEGVKEKALIMGLRNQTAWDQGILDLYRTTWDDGIFCCTFFHALPSNNESIAAAILIAAAPNDIEAKANYS